MISIIIINSSTNTNTIRSKTNIIITTINHNNTHNSNSITSPNSDQTNTKELPSFCTLEPRSQWLTTGTSAMTSWR